ncbi:MULTISPECIES: hypothetical protein [Enterococcus]|uniref:hypothetical protein n=1 Tax=Enterococcus TaxID=1350 RepID=UPI0019283C4B|nr:hypothetical protein [Enterococcus faecalis]MCD4978780.1 hypothetical protein [Enterococcus faecalis]MCU2263448.1 hypothetical protein [Enterococcus faecalis]MDG4629383.1 hypothetical protein [Enterococcus faecalis]MDG4632079.1 hypothetical protein [Enterococcus faecalis]GMC13298.1 hypothetical protein L3D_27440 [Enterococcus faecalis]
MIQEEIIEVKLGEKREKLRKWLNILDEDFGVKMTVIARELDIQVQNLHNFKKGKQTISVEKIFILERFLIGKYGKLLLEVEKDYESVSK